MGAELKNLISSRENKKYSDGISIYAGVLNTGRGSLASLNPKANRQGSILHAINLQKDFRPAAVTRIFRVSRLTPRYHKSVGDRPRLIRFIDILFNDSTLLREVLYS